MTTERPTVIMKRQGHSAVLNVVFVALMINCPAVSAMGGPLKVISFTLQWDLCICLFMHFCNQLLVRKCLTSRESSSLY